MVVTDKRSVRYSDACIDWKTTVGVLDTLRKGVQARRTLLGKKEGLNRHLNGGRAREVSRDGAKDFNDVNAFPVAA